MGRGLTRWIAGAYVMVWAIFHSGLFWACVFESIWRGYFWWPFTTPEQHYALGIAAFLVVLAAWTVQED